MLNYQKVWTFNPLVIWDNHRCWPTAYEYSMNHRWCCSILFCEDLAGSDQNWSTISLSQWQRCRPKGCFRRADNRQLRIGNVSFTVYTISGSALTSVTIFEFITSYRMYTYTGPTNYNGNSSRWTTPLRFRSKDMRRTWDKHTSNKRRMSTGWKTPIFISCLLLLSTSIDYGYIPPKNLS